MTVFEIVIALTVYGVLYVAIIEIVEKCEQHHADADQEALRHRHMAP